MPNNRSTAPRRDETERKPLTESDVCDEQDTEGSVVLDSSQAKILRKSFNVCISYVGTVQVGEEI